MALDLNYAPNVLVSTVNMPEHEWLKWRQKGIGGSDVASALGLSPYRTKRELYYDKVGIAPVVDGEDKSITFQIGHLLEDVVAQIFAKKTGFSVYQDQTMYQHPLFPFMLAVMPAMMPTTSVSISMEGKQCWILQSLPVSKEKIIQATISEFSKKGLKFTMDDIANNLVMSKKNSL